MNSLRSALTFFLLLPVFTAVAQPRATHQVGFGFGYQRLKWQDLLISPFVDHANMTSAEVRYHRVGRQNSQDASLSYAWGQMKSLDQPARAVSMRLGLSIGSFGIGDHWTISARTSWQTDVIGITPHGPFTEGTGTLLSSLGVGISTQRVLFQGVFRVQALAFPVSFAARPRYANARNPSDEVYWEGAQILSLGRARRVGATIEYGMKSDRRLSILYTVQLQYWSVDLPTVELRNSMIATTISVALIWSSQQANKP